MTLPVLQSVFSEVQLSALQTYITNQIAAQTGFDYTATASSSGVSATLDSSSGSIVFTNTIAGNTAVTYTIENSTISENSAVLFWLEDVIGGGTPNISYRLNQVNGTIEVVIKNTSATSVTGFTLCFRVLNAQ